MRVLPRAGRGDTLEGSVRATRGRPPKEDAMNMIAVAVTPVAVILRARIPAVRG